MKKPAVILNYLFVSAVLFFLVFIINKGFRFDDEGYYLVGYKSTQPIGTEITFFHGLVRMLFGEWATHIIFLRSIRIIFTILLSILLSNSFIKTIAKEERPFLIYSLIPVVFISIAISYLFGPQSFSYNTINQVLLVLFFVLAIVDLKSDKKNILYTVAIGIIIGLTFLNKLTSSFVMVFLYLVTIFINNETKNFIIKSIITGLSAILCLVLFNYLLRTDLVSNFITLYNYFGGTNSNHGTGSLFGSIKVFCFNLKFPAIVFIISFVVFRFSGILKKINHSYSILLPVIMSVVLIIYKYKQLVDTSPFIILILIWTAYLLAIICLNSVLNTKQIFFKKENLTITTLLLVLPICGALGSDTGILRNSLLYVFFWMLIPVFIIVIFKMQKLFLNVYSLNVVVLLSVQLIFYAWFNPFRQESLKEAKCRIINPYHASDQIYITLNQKRIIDSLSGNLYAHGYKKGDQVFGMENYLGYTFFLEGIIPNGFTFGIEGLPLYITDLKNKHQSLDESFIIIDEHEIVPVIKEFRNAGFDIEDTHIKSEIEEFGIFIFSPKQVL